MLFRSPLVRRVFAEIAAKDFVSVQPMNLPSGLVFYMDFKYGTAQPGFTKGNTSNDPTNTGYQNDSVFGITNTTSDPSQGLYGAGRFGYSINESLTSINASGSYTANATQVAITNIPGIGSATGTSDHLVDYDSKLIAAYSGSTAVRLLTVSSSALTRPD